MKFSDIIVETKKQELTEKPMGFLKSVGNKVASTFGSGQATGRLETGKEANQLRKDFDVFLGKTGQQATGDIVIQFLKQKGYPTKSASTLLGGEVTANVRAKGAETDPKATAPGEPKAPAQQPAAASGANAATQAKATPPAQQPTAAQQPASKEKDSLGRIEPTLDQPAQPGQPNKDDIAKRVKANVGKSQAATKGSGFGQPVEKPKAQPGAAAFGQMVQQLTKPVDQPKAQPAATPQPTQQQAATPQTQPAGRTQGGGKQAGTLSMTPGAIKKRQARAVKKRTAHPADDNPNIQLGTESIKYTFENRVNFYLMLAEALTAKQIDAVFLAAVQEKQKGGSTDADAAGAALSQPGADQAAKGGNLGLKMAAAAYDGMRGAALGATKLGQEEPGKQLKDQSGRVPQNIMSQINSLTNKQRAQLRKELDKA